MRPKPEIPSEIEDHRDVRWRRDPILQVETAADAERFIEQVGFAACLTDSRKAGALTLHRSLRTARRSDAAQRPERRGGITHLAAEG